MTWWQTLLVAVVPTAVTAASLVTQQALNARNERATHKMRAQEERANRRGHDVQDALRDALLALGSLEDEARTRLELAQAALRSGGDRSEGSRGLDPKRVGAGNDACAVVALLCGSAAVRTSGNYLRASHAAAEEAQSASATVESLNRHEQALVRARTEFALAARSELRL